MTDALADAERLATLLLDVEGTLLSYWTDLPESEVRRLTAEIRDALGGFEPRRDRCAVGVIDSTNPHLTGECPCDCHKEGA